MKNFHLLAASLTLLALLPAACGKKDNSAGENQDQVPRAEVVKPGGNPPDAPTARDVAKDLSKAASTTKEYLKDKARRTGAAMRDSAEEVGERIKDRTSRLGDDINRLKDTADDSWRDTRDWMLKSYEKTNDWGHAKKTDALAAWEGILVRSDEEIARLKKLAAEAGETGEAKWAESIEALESKKQLAEEKLAEVSQASFESWDELKAHFRQAAGDLQTAYLDARKNIEGEPEE